MTYNRVRAGMLFFGLVAALGGGSVAAQAPTTAAPPWPGRLTVHPREMATGTRNDRAGEQALDSLDGYLVYVPQQCVGTRRCPLVVFLPGGSEESRGVMDRERPRADEHGMILFVPNPVNSGRWDVIVGLIMLNPETRGLAAMYGVSEFPPGTPDIELDPKDRGLVRKMPYDPDVRNIDAALKQILRKFAIDPDKIALTGASDGGTYALFLGRNNLDIFSRVASRSPAVWLTGDTAKSPRNTAVPVLLTGGMGEPGIFRNALRAARDLQQNGHPVKRVLGLRPHNQRPEDHEYVWRWIRESWTASPVAAPAPESVPVLGAEALAKTIAFWKAFTGEPDSIRTTARLAHLKETAVIVGQTPMSVLMTDMPALAAKYPSVAGALKEAGLTAQEYQAYRIALVSAQATRLAEDSAGTSGAASVLRKNVEFLGAHPDELEALEAAEMWVTP